MKHGKTVLILLMFALTTGCVQQTQQPVTNQKNEDATTQTPPTPEEDTMIQAIDVPIDTTYPPGMSVVDQPVRNGAITLQQIVAPVNGWVVAVLPDNGLPGDVVGYAPIQEGTFDNFTLPITEPIVGDTLYILIHADQGEVGVWEFPNGPDLPVRYKGTVFAASILVTDTE